MLKPRPRIFAWTLLTGCLFTTSASAQTRSDSTAVQRIMAEGFQHSQVMETARVLTDVYGPRLTGSPLDSAAGVWAMGQMRAWGLVNVHPEAFTFDRRSWLNEKFFMQVTSPAPFPVLAMPAAWSVGTQGVVTAPAIIVRTAADLARLRESVRGKLVLVSLPFDGAALAPAPAVRLSQATLDEMVQKKKPWYALGHDSYIELNHQRSDSGSNDAGAYSTELMQALARGGAVGVLRSVGGVGGNFNVTSTGIDGLPIVEVAPEHYSRIFRTLEHGTPVSMEFEIRNRVSPANATPFNVIGEIAGSEHPEEVVMIGAHLDSWTGGTGGTDNAAGSAAMLEAIRILKASGLRPRRTIRIALWNGEEQGEIGSDAWVSSHIGTRSWQRRSSNGSGPDVILTPEATHFSAYINLDNGTGTIRGIDRYDNVAAEPILRQWLPLLHNELVHVSHITAIGNDASDDGSFDSRGVPTFYFDQDPLDYTRGTHHTSQDLYDRLDPAAMRHNAVVIASLAYLMANRDGLMPRPVRP